MMRRAPLRMALAYGSREPLRADCLGRIASRAAVIPSALSRGCRPAQVMLGFSSRLSRVCGFVRIGLVSVDPCR